MNWKNLNIAKSGRQTKRPAYRYLESFLSRGRRQSADLTAAAMADFTEPEPDDGDGAGALRARLRRIFQFSWLFSARFFISLIVLSRRRKKERKGAQKLRQSLSRRLTLLPSALARSRGALPFPYALSSSSFACACVWVSSIHRMCARIFFFGTTSRTNACRLSE